MKAILELTKEREEGDIFYRYDIDGTKVWFSQYPTNGNIYSVAIRGNEKLGDMITFRIQDDFNFDVCYPLGIDISIRYNLTLETIDRYIELMQYAKEVATTIMGVFSEGVHKDCYDKFHKTCE